MNNIRFNSSLKILLLIVFMYVLAQIIFGFPRVVISWDALGYYLYLPYGFIYNDLTFSDLTHLNGIVDQYGSTSTLYQLTDIENGNRIIKYPIGMAILTLPFFAIGHLGALLFGYPADGFSAPYETMMIVSNWFYLLIGMWYLRKMLFCFFSEKIVIIVLLLIFLGTNYLHLSLNQMAISHMPLFAMYSIALYLTHKWHKEPSYKLSIQLGLLIGLMIIIRPVEILFLLVVIFWGVNSFKSFISKYQDLLSNHWKKLLIFSVSLIAVGFIQLIYWKSITGSWLFYSYDNPGEGFDFFPPYIKEFLFSFRKGWLLYTPVMIFAVVGMFYSGKRKYNFGIGLLLFFLLNLWVISSWSCWWYAGSFSQRSIIQSYPILAIGLGIAISKIEEYQKLKKAFYILFGLFIVLNIFQSWQTKQGILHTDRMTKDYYFSIFGKTSIPSNADELLLVERSAESKASPNNLHLYSSKEHLVIQDSVFVSADAEFSPVINKPYKDFVSSDHAWINVKGKAKISSFTEGEGFLFVLTFLHKEKNYTYSTWPYSEMKTSGNDSIRTFDFWYLTPEVRRVEDELSCYIWNRAGSDVLITDLEIITFEKNKQ